jgi:hypothetical protein
VAISSTWKRLGVFEKFSAACWLYNWTAERWQRRGNRRVHVDFSHCPRITGIRSAARVTPFSPPSDAISVKNASASMLPLSRREIRRSCKALSPSILRSHMPIRSHYPHFAVHHDRPISVSSLDRRRGRENLSRKERRSSYEEGGCMTSDIALSGRPKASGRLADWHIRGLSRRPASQLPILQLARSHSPILQGMLLAESRMILPPRISPGPRNQDEYDMCCDNGETHQEAPHTSSTCGTWGTARQQPGRVVVRHFCDWLWCCNEGKPCPRLLSLRSTLQRGGDGATTRQIARGSGRLLSS